MFDLINGIPVHPLVVHAVVVLLPLAVVGVIAIAVRPAWRARYGWLVVAVAVIATVLVPVATSSGGTLEKRVGDPGAHAALGDQLIWFAIPLLVVALALVLLARRSARGLATPGPTWLQSGVAVLAVAAALASAVQVYRVGDSGAQAVWGDQVSSSTSPR